MIAVSHGATYADKAFLSGAYRKAGWPRRGRFQTGWAHAAQV